MQNLSEPDVTLGQAFNRLMFLESNLHRLLLLQLFVINFDSSDDGRGQIFDEFLQFSPHLRHTLARPTSFVGQGISYFFILFLLEGNSMKPTFKPKFTSTKKVLIF